MILQTIPSRLVLFNSLAAVAVFLFSPSSYANQPPSLDVIANYSVPARKTLIIPITATDPDGDALTYSFQTTDPQIQITQHTGNRWIKMSVAGFGDMVFQLLRDLAPLTADNIQGLVNGRFYDGTIFHRVINNFMIQGGDPTGTGTGGTGAIFDDEYNLNAIFTGHGLLAMANKGDDTNESQFFITIGPQRHLDFNHSIFGQLVRGFDVLMNIAAQETNANDRPLSDIVISKARTITNNHDAVITISAGENPVSATVTVTVEDGKGGSDSKTFSVMSYFDTWDSPPFLNPMPDRTTPVNTPVTIQLSASDIEGSSPFFGYGLLNSPTDGTITYDDTTHTLTVTPANGFAGALGVAGGVLQRWHPDPNQRVWDTQVCLVAVGESPVTASSNPITVVKSVPMPPDTVVAEFTTPNTQTTAGDFYADVNWGDGNVTDGSIQQISPGHFRIVSFHNYEGDGQFPLTITLYSNLGLREYIRNQVTVRRRVVSLRNRDLGDPISQFAKDTFFFKTSGRVTFVDSKTFKIDDGSKLPITVKTEQHTLVTNDYAIVQGELTPGTPPVLECPMENIWKQN